LTIVGTDGIDAVTTRRLAEDAQLAPETVETHYPAPSDCLYDTYDEVARSIYQDFRAAFASEPGWRNALRLASRTLLRRLVDRPAEARLCFAEILHGDYELLRRRELNRRRLVGLFVGELRRRCDYPEPYGMQIELLIGASFQAIAGAVAEGRLADYQRLAAELESRAVVFEPVAA
jgi:AcrR family transcriptional regulator